MTITCNNKETASHIYAIQYFRKVLNFTREDHSIYSDGLLTVEDVV